MRIQKIFGFYLMAIVGFFPCANIEAEELPWERKLPFENATIHYTVSGVEQGQEILYIRNFGKEQATYSDSTTTLMGMAVSQKSIDFVDVDYVYSYDLQAQEATKSVNPLKYMAKAYGDLTSEEQKQVQKNATEMGGLFTEGIGGALQENAIEILGYSCDKIDIMGGGATYMIHGTSIPLKTEMNMMGMKMVSMATSIDTGKVDPKYFIHPEGIVAEIDPEVSAMGESMGYRIMNALKDPEAAKKSAGAGTGRGAMQENMTEEDMQMMEQAGELLQQMQDIFGQ